MQVKEWVVCVKGVGRKISNGKEAPRNTHFNENSVGLLESEKDGMATVWLIGGNETWLVPISDIKSTNVINTGDRHKKKICNICHCLFDIKEFAKNQNNKHGIVRWPSCRQCRTDIDKRAIKTKQAKEAEKNRPQKGTFLSVQFVAKGQS